MISREEARLRRVIERLLVVSLAGAPAACSSESVASSMDGGGSSALADSAADGTVSPRADGGGADAALDSTVAEGGGLDASACEHLLLDGSPDGAADAGDGFAGCTWYAAVPCNLAPDAGHDGCDLLLSDCQDFCGEPARCNVFECGDAGVIPSGALTVECINRAPRCTGVVGRRPAGLRDARRRSGGDAAGEWLADAARLEAASVHAFLRLGAELEAMGAPTCLVREAERSARDEVRHARITRRLARGRGAAPSRVAVKRGGARSIEAFAIENAVEGCVREAFGALVASRQALLARDADVRAAMVDIARDEIRHAALASSIAEWLSPRLDAGVRARVATAMRGAVDGLRCEVRAMPSDVAASLGLPAGAEGARLVDAFVAAVWA
jgi:hypothetical protein